MARIQLHNVSVEFPIYDASARSLTNQVLAVSTGGRIGAHGGRVVVKALDGINLAIEHGDRLALVGHNGAGKSTLLRIMAGIYEPAFGNAEIEGRIAPLFETSVGTDPESTGIENILLRGLYLGMTKAEIRAKTKGISDFTELGPFLDMPMRTYSSGMRARLTFAISTSIEPNIVLLDEDIGSGDASFIEKARHRIDALVAQAGIVVLASHSEDLVRRMCNKAVLLEHGAIIAQGPVDDVLARYARGP